MYQYFLTRLAEEIASQPEAIKAFARTAVRALHGHSRGHRPLAVILIAGPAGTGKGLLTRAFARLLLGRDGRIIRLNSTFHGQVWSAMQSLFAECAAHDATLLPGERPLRIVFVDSVEKATRSLIDMLIHIFHNGDLSLQPGVTLDFRQTVFVLETGLAEREVDAVITRAVGFKASELDAHEQSDERIREQIESRIHNHFSPRFLSLLDEVVLFRRIREDDLSFILEHFLARLRQHLQAFGADLHVEEAARGFLLAEGRRSLRYGAKGLRQATDRYLETPVLAALSTNALPPGSVIFARRSLEGITLFVPTL